MEDFVAYTSRLKVAFLGLGSLAFVVIGLWMGGTLGFLPMSDHFSDTFTFVVGWFSVIFFGFCGYLWFKKLFDNSEQLRIGPKGVRSAPWSDQTIPWSEITDVTTWSFNRQKAIVLHLRDATCFPGNATVAMFARVNRKLTGGDVSISMSGTDRSFQEAMAAIGRFRR